MFAAHSQAQGNKPVALVYRGPAACDGCAEAAAAMLIDSGLVLDVKFVGPDEDLDLSAEVLAHAALYVQPGGDNDLERTFNRYMKPYKALIRNYLKNGGRYLGICMGGYLAGQPGFDIIPGKADQYIALRHAEVKDDDDTVIELKWGDAPRLMYFQDGPFFSLSEQNPFSMETQVLARYKSRTGHGPGEIAAMVAPYFKGKVGVIGPHPEASRSWFLDNDLDLPHQPTEDLGRELLLTLMR